MKKTPSSAQAELFTLVMDPPVQPTAAKRTPRISTDLAPKVVPTTKAAPMKTTKSRPVQVAKTVPVKAAKTVAVKAAKDAPPMPVRVTAEISGASGRAWRMTSRYAVAYVKDATLAGELLATDTKHLAKSAMAVYYDRKGKAFAWQVRFDAARWDEVVGRLG